MPVRFGLSRPGSGEEPVPLGDLLRVSGQDAAFAGLILVMTVFGTVARLLTGVSPAALAALVPLAGGLGVSGALALRARLILLRTLGDVRVHIGAPLDPRVPWTPTGSYAPVEVDVLRRELQRLVGAVYRCHDLALNALIWALGTFLFFLVWLLL